VDIADANGVDVVAEMQALRVQVAMPSKEFLPKACSPYEVSSANGMVNCYGTNSAS
jgi:hypothetical protein